MIIKQLTRRQFSILAGKFTAGRAQRSFSEASWQKIQAVKDKYDPDGVFHTYIGHS